jgi:type II secretory pathway predicted ATPase ExeA
MKEIPFRKEVRPNELFESQDLKEGLARLELALDSEEFILISGTPGCGKSSLVRRFIHRLDGNGYLPGYIAGGRNIGEVAKEILKDLKLTMPFHGTAAIRALKSEFEVLYRQKGKLPVVVVDEADSLSAQTLSHLKLLTNFSMDSKRAALFILCGSEQIESTLKRSEMEALRQRIQLRYRVKGLSLEESSQYIDHHMKIAGVLKKVFSDEAKAEIFRASNGVMRVINDLCFNLIITAVVNKKEIIESSLLREVIG